MIEISTVVALAAFAAFLFWIWNSERLAKERWEQNVGKSPALRAVIDSHEISFDGTIDDEAAEWVAKWKASYQKSLPRGETLFPTDSLAKRTNFKVAPETIDHARTKEPGKQFVSPTFVACVTYSADLDDSVFQTYFVVTLAKPQANGTMMSLSADEPKVLAKDLAFQMYPSSQRAS